LIYSAIRVIDGDTIEVKRWFGLAETCRIKGLDCDEITSGATQNKHKAIQQKRILQSFVESKIFKPYVFETIKRSRQGWRKRESGKYGRLLVTVYVWSYWRYVNYAELMVKNGDVKKGSKWNL